LKPAQAGFVGVDAVSTAQLSCISDKAQEIYYSYLAKTNFCKRLDALYYYPCERNSVLSMG
jgi:hypothetical protein